MKTINNQDKIAKKINNLNLEGVIAVGDDGSVCVEVKGDKAYTKEVAEKIDSYQFDNQGVGDGVQEGGLWINNYEQKIHGELYDVMYL